jgi:hypothetical protein
VLHRAQMERERRVSWWAEMVRVVVKSMSIASRIEVVRMSIVDMVARRWIGGVG